MQHSSNRPKPTISLQHSMPTGPDTGGVEIPQPAPRLSKAQRHLIVAIGVLLTVLLESGGLAASFFLSGHQSALFRLFSGQQVTTGAHITKIQTGTGFDQNTGVVTGETGTFRVGQTAYVVFTVQTSDSSPQVILKLFLGDQLEDTSDTLAPDQGTHVYSRSVSLIAAGKHKIEVDYNGAFEASITFDVTS